MFNERARRMKWELFVLSFTALFLELTVIRWVPSVVSLVAYYANLMLLSSFLGLGLGALAARSRRQLFRWFPVLLGADILVLLFCRGAAVGFSSAAEARFYSSHSTVLNALLLLLVFAVNALLFVPLGQRLGELFEALPRLTAYAWDLAGSLCGTLCFGGFSLLLFSPVLGMGVIMGLFLSVTTIRRWPVVLPLFAMIILLMRVTGEDSAIWSPYYYITQNPIENPAVKTATPPPDLRSMVDPPVYVVCVNNYGYHLNGALDPARYTPGTFRSEYIRRLVQQYQLPYTLGPAPERVLVLGAGGGSDVQAALAAGARHVDAVEIDPAVVAISRRFNAGAPYADPRVSVHVDDARSFVSRATAESYDLVVFGYLDSQALFSTMSNVRLDGYIYTVESIRAAFRLLRARGLLSLSFNTPNPWLAPKLVGMVAQATGQTPALYVSPHGGVVLCVSKDLKLKLPSSLPNFQRAVLTDLTPIDPPTDDWPFLYLQRKTIPADYLLAIGSLLLVSVAAVGALGGRTVVRGNRQFFFLGLGFLLLETKSIGDCTLYFGATWLVTLIVVAGVLAMVLAANLVAERLRAFAYWLYAPLLVSLLVLAAVPRELILGLGFGPRLAWSLVIVPLPVFFAGLIFSTKFRESASPSAAFGANLLGAMCGGFCEYLAMAIGNRWLAAIVLGAYLASLLAVRGAGSRGAASVHPPSPRAG